MARSGERHQGQTVPEVGLEQDAVVRRRRLITGALQDEVLRVPGGAHHSESFAVCVAAYRYPEAPGARLGFRTSPASAALSIASSPDPSFLVVSRDRHAIETDLFPASATTLCVLRSLCR